LVVVLRRAENGLKAVILVVTTNFFQPFDQRKESIEAEFHRKATVDVRGHLWM